MLIGHLGINFSEILNEIQTFSLKKIRFKMSSAKCRTFCLGLNVLTRISLGEVITEWESLGPYFCIIHLKEILHEVLMNKSLTCVLGYNFEITVTSPRGHWVDMLHLILEQHPGPNLTHWGRDKMAAIFQTTFSNAFSWMKYMNFDRDFTEVCSQGSN